MILPVSLQVLDAGEGGGGISSLSVFSLFEFDFVAVAEIHKNQSCIRFLPSQGIILTYAAAGRCRGLPAWFLRHSDTASLIVQDFESTSIAESPSGILQLTNLWSAGCYSKSNCSWLVHWTIFHANLRTGNDF